MTDKRLDKVKKMAERFNHNDSVSQATLHKINALHLSPTNQQTAKLEALRAEIQKGIDDIEAGRYTTFETPEALGAFLDEETERIISEVESEQSART